MYLQTFTSQTMIMRTSSTDDRTTLKDIKEISERNNKLHWIGFVLSAYLFLVKMRKMRRNSSKLTISSSARSAINSMKKNIC